MTRAAAERRRRRCWPTSATTRRRTPPTPGTAPARPTWPSTSSGPGPASPGPASWPSRRTVVRHRRRRRVEGVDRRPGRVIPSAAADDYRRLIVHWRRAGMWSTQWTMLRSIAGLLARLGRSRDAAVLEGAVRATDVGHRIFGADESPSPSSASGCAPSSATRPMCGPSARARRSTATPPSSTPSPPWQPPRGGHRSATDALTT